MSVVACHRLDAARKIRVCDSAAITKNKNAADDGCVMGTLENEERLAFDEETAQSERSSRGKTRFLPCLGYADIEPFRAARVRSSPRTLTVYVTGFKGNPPPKPLASCIWT